MKKIILALLLALALMPSLAIAVPNSSVVGINIVITKYEPFPAGPGEYVNVWFKTIVSGRSAANLTLELQPSFPFSLDPGDTAIHNLGAMLAGSESLVRYRLRVDEDAVEGTNKLRLRYKSDALWVSQLFDIEIRTVDAVVAVENVVLTPEQITPGGTARLSITLKNLADSLVKDVTLSLDLSSSAIPIAPLSSTAEKKVKSITAGGSEDVVIELIALPGAASDIYKVPITVTYYDEVGTSYNRTSIISLTVGGEPEIIATLDSSTINKLGSSGEVVLRLVNPTPVDIKFLTLELMESEEYELLSTSNLVYIGDLDSDDIDTAKFSLYVNKNADGNVELPLLLTYMDANNRPYTKETNVDLRLFTSKEKSAMGLNGGSSKINLALFALFAGLAYFGYKRWKKTSRRS